MAGVLCGAVVSRRVLVLLGVHVVHADSVRGHPGTATAAQHGRDQEDGKQATSHTGNYPLTT